MRRSAIEEQNRCVLTRLHEFRLAADVGADAVIGRNEVDAEAVAVIGSVAKPLWK